MKNYYKMAIMTLLALSCQKAPLTQNDCEQLSMDSFRGLPDAAAEFKANCQQFKIHYTKELCQNALVDLVYTANRLQLVEKYGERIMGCFNQNDLDKFGKD